MKNSSKKSSFKTGLFLLAAALSVSPISANDSAISGTSGTPGNMKATRLAGEHKTIRMVREQIEMTIRADDYITDARFVFHNDGAATSIQMGFPESSYGDVGYDEWAKKTSFKKFQTWVDGREIKATRMFAAGQIDESSFDAFWVKPVRFARGQTRNVRVRYVSDLGGSTNPSDFVAYDFTGGNWKGKVEESTLRATFAIPGNYHILKMDEDTGKPFRRVTGNSVFLRWRNWEAEEGYVLHFSSSLPGALMQATDIKDLDEASQFHVTGEKLIVRNAEKFDPWKSQVNWTPSGVLRDGRAFVQFRDLYIAMLSAWEKKKNDHTIKENVGMFMRGDWYYAPYYGKGSQTIGVRVGEKTAKIGARNVELSAAPFVASGVLYVPLASMVEALGGKAKVNAKTSRFWFEVPV